MRRTMGIVAVVVAVTAGAVALGSTRDQGTPEGTPPLQKYHITPGRSAGADERRGEPARSRGQAGRTPRCVLPPGFSHRPLRGWHRLPDAAQSDRGPERRPLRGRFERQHDHTPARHEQRRQGGRAQSRGLGAEPPVRHGDQQRLLLRRQHRQHRALEVRARRRDASPARPRRSRRYPSGGGHWTRSLAFSEDGSKLYVTSAPRRTSTSNGTAR